MTGWKTSAMAAPADWSAFGFMLVISLTATAAETPPAPDMDLIEFLGSVETEGASVAEVLTAIDAGLLPDLPEEPPHETK